MSRGGYALLLGGQMGAAAGLGKRLAPLAEFRLWLEGVSPRVPEAGHLLLEAPPETFADRFTGSRLMVLYDHACAVAALARLGTPAALAGHPMDFTIWVRFKLSDN